MVCTTVSISLLSIAAFATDRKSPLRASPLAAPHHASYSKPSVKAAKPVKKTHFWNK
jgi:hypothetical protein